MKKVTPTKKKTAIEIEVKETVTKSVMLVVGEDITEKEAEELLELDDYNAEYDIDSKEYGLLDRYLDNEPFDSDGFQDIQIRKIKV